MYKKEILEEVNQDIQKGLLTLTDIVQVLKINSDVYDYYYSKDLMEIVIKYDEELAEVYSSVENFLKEIIVNSLITILKT